MSLVNQFDVTLKDFWPDHSDGMFVTDRDRGTTTTISRQLYVELKAYAEENRLSFDIIVKRLHDEIHSRPITNDHVAVMAPKFAKGNRVKLSAKGVQNFPRWSPDRRGTVTTNPSRKCLAVKWDSMKSVQYLSRSYLERSDD